MKEIELTKGYVALVDDEDYPALSLHSWRVSECPKTCYAIRGAISGGKVKTLLMHREIMNPPDGMLVDHINGNGLDNRRSNLRIVNTNQNHYNQSKRMRKTSSIYKGVSWKARDAVWVVQIQAEGKHHIIGRFKNEVDAAKAYNEAATLYHGSHAKLNTFIEGE